MATPRKPTFLIETRHVFDVNINVNQVRDVWNFLNLIDDRLSTQEETMRKVKTLLRELREGLDALAQGEDQEDQDAAARDAANAARITELEALVAELQARPSLTPEQQTDLNAMVEELAQRTGNVITDDEDQTPADDDDEV